jgi:ribbon-helix-helix CopG family protein
MPSATNSTVSLDAASLARLQTLAQKWQVPKTEALRRLLREAGEDQEETLSPEEKIALLHDLQRRLKEQGVDFEKWKKTIRNGRR